MEDRGGCIFDLVIQIGHPVATKESLASLAMAMEQPGVVPCSRFLMTLSTSFG